MNFKTLTSPVGILRILQVVFSCIAFSLVASVKAYTDSYGSWSMFTWCLCFAITICIIVLELTGLCQNVPISWDDFTSAFSMLASLMLFTTSIMYPAVYLQGTCTGNSCGCRAGATAMSILCFFAYAIEVGLTRAKPGEISGFLSTIPGLLKVFQAYVTCVIFSLLPGSYPLAGIQWCVAVYSICFIITTLVIILTIGRLLPRLPINFEKILIGYNILAVAMYITVAVMWPYYWFKNIPTRPSDPGQGQAWDNILGVTFLTYINLIAYIVDLVYSTRMVFFVVPA
ncbi:myeloid-associated differentiation marker-like [Pelobates fuscus]|uniref:myeloid-associated differentiation marker-like n=1 Tax=Pelobates fuscus TaxID=191477 RepID=UPI002FE44C43